MSSGTKVLLIVTAVCLAGFAGLVGASVWWYRSNEAELKAGAERAEAEGKALGTRVDQATCRKEVLLESRSCGDMDFVCTVHLKLFYTACLAHAAPSEGFCEGVPARDAITDTAMWVVEECRSVGLHNHKACTRMMSAQQRFCRKK